MTLGEINKHYENIMHSDLTDIQQDKELCILMSYMEKEFDIPAKTRV